MKVVEEGTRRELSPEELTALAGIVGAVHVVSANGDLEPFGRDWTEDWRATPAAAARPRSTAEVQKPAAAAVLVAPFATLEEVARAVVEITRRGLVPSALEIVDRPSVDVSFRKKGLPVPFPEAEARLLVELDGGGEEEVERAVTRAGEIVLDCGALDAVLAAAR